MVGSGGIKGSPCSGNKELCQSLWWWDGGWVWCCQVHLREEIQNNNKKGERKKRKERKESGGHSEGSRVQTIKRGNERGDHSQ